MRAAFLLAAATLLHVPAALAQWEVQDSGTKASLRGIHYVGGGVAWASGTDGTVLRTEDSGYVWQGCAIPPGAEHLDFRAVQAFDENTALVMSSGPGDGSRLYKTTDGCRSWKLVFTNPDKDGFWDALRFSDPKHGFLLGDPIAYGSGKYKRIVLEQTFDGGDTWTAWQRTIAGLDVDEDTSAFAASNSALITEDRFSTAFATGGKAGATLRYTITHGNGICNCAPMPSEKDWNDQMEVIETGPAPFPKTSAGGIFSIAMSESHIVAVGGDYTQPNIGTQTAAYVLRGGHNRLEPAQTPPHGYRSSVAYDPTHQAWITVGPNGTDVSTDDGRNWRPLTPTPQDQPGADRDWNALSLPFVVGPHGRIGKLRGDALPSATAAPAKPKP